MHISFDFSKAVTVAIVTCFDQNYLPKVSKNDVIFLNICHMPWLKGGTRLQTRAKLMSFDKSEFSKIKQQSTA